MFTGPTLRRMFRRNTTKNRTRQRFLNRLNKSPKARLMLTSLEERAVPASLYIVSGTGDVGNADDLRANVTLANADPGSTIGFDNSVFTLASTITLGSPLTLSAGVKITGTDVGGSSSMAISGGGVTRMFEIGAAGQYTFDNISLINGNATTVVGGGAVAVMPTVGVNASVTFANAVVSGNTCTSEGGAVYLPDLFTGLVSVNTSTFSGNKTTAKGGAIYFWNTGALSVTGSTFSGNTVTAGTGGADSLHTGTATITGSNFTNNSASTTGGAITSSITVNMAVTSTTFTSNKSGGAGGAINNAGGSTVTVNNSLFASNESGGAGGDINNASSGTVNVASTSFTSNTGGSTGGAIFSTNSTASNSITYSVFRNNFGGGNGGAMQASGKITFSNNLFEFNTATSLGGAVHIVSATTAFTFNNNTLYRNSATGNGGGLNSTASVALTINQSTFNQNISSGTGGGGGIALTGTGNVVINNSTIYDNTAAGASTAANGGGISRTSTSAVTITSTMVAANKITGTGTRGKDIHTTQSTTFTIPGNNNIIGTNTNSSSTTGTSSITWSGTGNSIGIDSGMVSPSLVSISNQGGFTLGFAGETIKTMGYKSTSTVGINTGLANGFTEDQRGPGFTRTIGTADVGAFEGLTTNPVADAFSAGSVPASGGGSHTFAITYYDDSGFDTTSFGVTDVLVTGQGYGAGVNADTFSVNSGGAPKSYIVTYTVLAPSGGWGNTNIGTYSVAVTNGAVTDDSTNTSGGGALGTFKTGFANSVSVNNKTDVDDGVYGAGNVSFREALRLSNANTGFTNSITFDSTVFNAASTISLTAGASTISESLNITGPNAALTFDANNTTQRFTQITGKTLTISKLGFTNFTGTAGPVFLVPATSTFSLGSSTFTNNKSSGTGGVMDISTAVSVTISNSVFTGNTGTTGGVLYMSSSATSILSVSGSTFTNNVGTSSAGDFARAVSPPFKTACLRGTRLARGPAGRFLAVSRPATR